MRPWRWNRWTELTDVERVGLYTWQSLYSLVWGFNGITLTAVASRNGGSEAVGLLVGGLAVSAAAFAALREARGRYPDLSPPVRHLAALLALSAVYVVVAFVAFGQEVRVAALVVVAVSVTLPLGLLTDKRVLTGVLLALVATFVAPGGEPTGIAARVVLTVLFLFSARASVWLLGIVTELDAARRAQAQLAVVEERLRFSRDVHDVLGRRLSTIAVQAELAATLAERGEDRAAAQMLEVRGVAHEALREARELARGYRTTDFSKELEGARSLLRSAGMEVRVEVEAMPRAWQEAAGWVVREAVTNVLRHSRASVVEIDYAEQRLRVANDGARPGAPSDGSGLQGLRERLVPLGASLQAQAGEDDRWVLEAHLPGSGPLSARTPSARE